MNLLQPFLAQNLLPTDVLPGASHWLGLSLKELLLVLGAVSAVTLLLVLWAVYFRKGPRRHSHHHHHRAARGPSTSSVSADDADAEGAEEKPYRRKRRRRREHRPRNPTLAETGGLPPLRAERPQDPLP